MFLRRHCCSTVYRDTHNIIMMMDFTFGFIPPCLLPTIGLLRRCYSCQIDRQLPTARFINEVLSAGATKVYSFSRVVLATAAVGTWRALALKLRIIRLYQRLHLSSRLDSWLHLVFTKNSTPRSAHTDTVDRFRDGLGRPAMHVMSHTRTW